MPIDTTPSNVATSALQAIPFGSVIGGPLVAGVEAQSLAAQATWQFIQEVGLTDDKKAVNVDFIYVKDGRETKLVVPLLTIVPIPFFAIDQMTIDFKANISASASSVQEVKSSQEFNTGNETSASVGGWFAKGNTKFYANYSSKKDSTATQDSKYSVEYTMDVHVNASQHDMPAGLASILNILQSSIDSTIPEANFQVSPNPLVVADPLQNENLVVTVTAFDQKGLRAKTIEVKPGTATPAPEGGAKVEASSSSVKTDKNGIAEFTIEYEKATAATDGTTIPAQRLKLEFTAKINGQDVTEQVLIVIPAIPPAPTPTP